MIKKILFFAAALSVTPIFLVCAFSQEDLRFVSPEPFGKPRRPPAVFRHDDHNDAAGIEDCAACHHVYDEDGKLVVDESSEDLRCAECHRLEPDGSRPALMKAFHTHCKGCHQAQKAGPVLCGQCHARGLTAAD